jgi:hypothetical protein
MSALCPMQGSGTDSHSPIRNRRNAMALSVQFIATIIDAHLDGLAQAKADSHSFGIRYNQKKLDQLIQELERNEFGFSYEDVEWLNEHLKEKQREHGLLC